MTYIKMASLAFLAAVGVMGTAAAVKYDLGGKAAMYFAEAAQKPPFWDGKPEWLQQAEQRLECFKFCRRSPQG